MILKTIKIAILLTISTTVLASQVSNSPKVIYGEDDRNSVQIISSEVVKTLAQSTAAMIPNDDVFIKDNRITFPNAKTLEDSIHACPGEKFAKEITPAYCSGFLVTEDILVTAGHCIPSQDACDNNLWVFDFKSSDGEIIVSKSVYKCVKILDRQFSPWNLHNNDYSVIKLDRVTGRKFLPIRTEGDVPADASLMIAGHPSGLPLKIAGGAGVRDNSETYFFVANLDSFGGNSGSPVIDLNSGIIEGILVRGDVDYVRDPERECYMSNQIANHEGRGEDVTRITNIDLAAILNGTHTFEPIQKEESPVSPLPGFGFLEEDPDFTDLFL